MDSKQKLRCEIEMLLVAAGYEVEGRGNYCHIIAIAWFEALDHGLILVGDDNEAREMTLHDALKHVNYIAEQRK
jgi:hypothetical protein